MATIERRLAALREYLKTISADETVFIVEGGKEFRTKQDAFTFLREHGAYTLDGRRIVLYPVSYTHLAQPNKNHGGHCLPAVFFMPFCVGASRPPASRTPSLSPR